MTIDNSNNLMLPDLNQELYIGLIGLGYVGFPLALEISKLKNRKVIGYDIDTKRIDELLSCKDKTGSASDNEISKYLKKSKFTANPKELSLCDVFIVCVPTPVDEHNNPNLNSIKKATFEIADTIKYDKATKKRIIIYESTVYPGVTEEICGEILKEKLSSEVGDKFVLGYSPERLSPGIIEEKKLTEIVKITSGSDQDTASWIDDFYSSFITAGTFKANSIKVAEAAKVVENIQRDINIALMNELSLLFSYMNIDTNEVIDAASTKWNFLEFRPGLVGGHCVGVDPYYLSYAAERYKVHAELIKSGRRINDNMAGWIARQVVRKYNRSSSKLISKNILVLGACFKENCPDIRNSQSVSLAKKLMDYGFKVEVSDYIAYQYGIHKIEPFNILKDPDISKGYSVVICAVSHTKYKEWSISDWNSLKENESSLLVDVKNIIPRSLNPMRF